MRHCKVHDMVIDPEFERCPLCDSLGTECYLVFGGIEKLDYDWHEIVDLMTMSVVGRVER